MKRLKALIGLYLILGLSTIIQSCCTNDYTILHSGVLSAYDLNSDGSIGDELDRIQGPFRMNATFETELLVIQASSFISSAYATTCAERYKNPILEGSLELFVDGVVVWKGDTLDERTNLLDLDDAGIALSSLYGPSIELDFNQDFFDHAAFPDSLNLFVLTALTDNNTLLSAERTFQVDR